jgi:hypothetical protein
MVGNRLLRLAGSEFLSLNCRQTKISAFLVVSCRRSFSLRLQAQPGGFFFCFFGARRMLTGEPFNPTFFGKGGITSEPNRVAHRCSKRL